MQISVETIPSTPASTTLNLPAIANCRRETESWNQWHRDSVVDFSAQCRLAIDVKCSLLTYVVRVPSILRSFSKPVISRHRCRHVVSLVVAYSLKSLLIYSCDQAPLGASVLAILLDVDFGGHSAAEQFHCCFCQTRSTFVSGLLSS